MTYLTIRERSASSNLTYFCPEILLTNCVSYFCSSNYDIEERAEEKTNRPPCVGVVYSAHGCRNPEERWATVPRNFFITAEKGHRHKNILLNFMKNLSALLLLSLVMMSCQKEDTKPNDPKGIYYGNVVDITPDVYGYFRGNWADADHPNDGAIQFINDTLMKLTFNDYKDDGNGFVRKTLEYHYVLSREQQINLITLSRPDTVSMEGRHPFALIHENAFKFEDDIYVRK